MRVLAPGKLLLTGSYAVLEGAPAIVCAVDRHVFATEPTSLAPSVIREVAFALEGRPVPAIDVAALFQGGTKLGLGSSAAAVVAALGYHAARAGDDLGAPAVQRRIFDEARAAHARAQSGGSGVDVAASVYGGVLRYTLTDEHAAIVPRALPPGVRVDAYFAGVSSRTSDMRGRVDALRAKAPGRFEACMGDLVATAHAAARAVEIGNGAAFIAAAAANGEGLAALGRDADAPIVPAAAESLARLARAERAAFLPSGAGGGDVFVRIAMVPPSTPFLDAVRASRFTPLGIHVDPRGVRLTDPRGDSLP